MFQISKILQLKIILDCFGPRLKNITDFQTCDLAMIVIEFDKQGLIQSNCEELAEGEEGGCKYSVDLLLDLAEG